MERYAFLIGVVALGAVGLGVSSYVYHRRRSQPGTKDTWLSYVLLWPLVLDADKDQRGGRFLTKREWLGWGIVLLLIILGVVFTPSRNGG
jgi:hypothetical protein